MSSNGRNLVSKISNFANLPVITSVKKFLDNNKNVLLEKDILATNIYTLGYSANNSNQLGNLDYTWKL